MEVLSSSINTINNGLDSLSKPETVVAGYNVNLSSAELAFSHALDQAELAQRHSSAAEDLSAPSAVLEALMSPFSHIDVQASQLADYAEQAAQSGSTLNPGDVVMLTARSQEFMFHSQLLANIANRTTDGLQQLFRQQS